MCSDTTSGKAFIQDLNKVLQSLNKSNALFNVQQKYVAPKSRDIFK